MTAATSKRSVSEFVFGDLLYVITAVGALVAVFTAVNWATLPFLQRMVALFFIAVVVHLWEEGKYPGGFTTMITEKLNFTAKNPHFGEGITVLYVLFITLLPLVFPDVVFVAVAPMLLGILEVVAHLAAIKMFNLDRFYSPGLVTAVFVMLPISLWTISYVVQHGLMAPLSWVLSLLYMFAGLMLAQQIVIRTGGMSYTEFLRNVRSTFADSRS